MLKQVLEWEGKKITGRGIVFHPAHQKTAISHLCNSASNLIIVWPAFPFISSLPFSPPPLYPSHSLSFQLSSLSFSLSSPLFLSSFLSFKTTLFPFVYLFFIFLCLSFLLPPPPALPSVSLHIPPSFTLLRQCPLSNTFSSGSIASSSPSHGLSVSLPLPTYRIIARLQ